MLIYEKDNKLNINFENSIEEQPDLPICKSGDKTEVLIDGQPCGGSGGGTLVVNIIDGSFDKTAAQVYSALTTTGCVAVQDGEISQISYGRYRKNEYLFSVYINNLTILFVAQNADDYPVATN